MKSLAAECESPNETGVRKGNQVQLFPSGRTFMQHAPGGNARVTRPVFASAFLALSLMAAAIPVHATVNKWVDENGNAQYSDHPPDKRKITPLHLQAAPINPQPESGEIKNVPNPMQDRHQQLLDEANARLKAARDSEAAEEKVRAEQKRIADEREAAQKAIDDKRIAECKHNHEIYCDNGVEGIDRAEAVRNAEFGVRQERALRGGY